MAFHIVRGSVDEKIAENRRLWEIVRISLPDEAVTFEIANDLGSWLDKNKGQYKEAKGFYLAALEGRRRVLGDEHKDTLVSLNNMGVVLDLMKDSEGALDYYEQTLRVQEKVLGRHTLARWIPL